jgi:integrase
LRRGYINNNPVIGTEAVKTGPSRERTLDDNELAMVWRACGNDDLGRITKLLILSGCRANEIGGLKWSEIDLERGVIAIPAARIKNNRELKLPITDMMREVIAQVLQRVGRDHLFGERSDSGFAFWSKQRSLRDVIGGERWTLHDLRRTFRTGLSRIGVQPHVAELAVNHRKSGIESVYDRHSYSREIAAAFAQWSDHVQSIVTGNARKIVALRTN